jgi:hypothetical protein
MKLYLPMADDVGGKPGLAPRLATLDGARVVLLDNGKWNSNRLLDGVEALLREHRRPAEIIRLKKPAFTRPAPPELLAELARRADAVITSIGD